jgi:hypothetical protein
MIVWLYGTLVLAERRIGVRHHPSRVAPWVGHARRPHDGGGDPESSGTFCVWSLLALGVTAIFSLILSARRLWSLR